MAFELTKITTKDTDDVVEAMATTSLLLSSILYESVMEKKIQNYESDIIMAYNALRMLTKAIETRIEGFDLQIPMIIEPEKGFCSFCGTKHVDAEKVVKAGSRNVSICSNCVELFSSGLV